MTRSKSIELFFNIVVVCFSFLGLVSTASNIINGFTIINTINIVLNILLYLSFMFSYGKQALKTKGKEKSKYFRETISIAISLYSLSMIILSGYYNSLVNYAFIFSLILLWQTNRKTATKLILISSFVAVHIAVTLLQFFSILPIFHYEVIVNYEIYIIVERLISTFIVLSIIITKTFYLLNEKYSSKDISLKLTPRQKQITLLFQEGFTDKEVIDKLNISQGTMKKHKHDIWKVFEVSSQNDFIKKIQNINF